MLGLVKERFHLTHWVLNRAPRLGLEKVKKTSTLIFKNKEEGGLNARQAKHRKTLVYFT